MIHPLWHVLCFGLLAVAVPLLKLPELAAGFLAAAFFLGITLRHPLNGVSFLFLVIPFFLGEAYKSPAFLLLPGMVGVVIVLGFWFGLRSKVAWVWPHRGLVLFYLASLVVALPLDLKELREDLWVFFPADLPGLVLRGLPAVSHLYPLQVVGLALLGAGLYVVVVNLRPSAEFVRRTIIATALVYGGVALVGLMKHAGGIPYQGRYLSLSFAQYVTVGDHPHRLTALAWNPDYYAQYLAYVAPWMLGLILSRGWRDRLWGLALVPAVFALTLTFQRSAYLVLLVELALAALYTLWLSRRAAHTRPVGRPWVFVGLLACLVFAVLAGDAALLGGAILARFRAIWVLGDPHRTHLWQVALSMGAAQPLLGVGTGRFAYFFSQYSSLTPREFGPFWGTAHGLYLQALAEGGIIGLSALGLLIAGIVADGLRGLRAASASSMTLLGAGLVSLGGWLTYGLLQHTLYIWGPQIYFWLLAALLGSLARGAGVTLSLTPRWTPRGPLAIGFVVAHVLAVGWRAWVVVSVPRPNGYEAGFFRWESQPDQSLARWTGRRAAQVLPTGGSTLVLAVSAPLPGIDERPQTLTAQVEGGTPTVLVVPGRRWVELRLPVSQPRGGPVLLRLETAYATNPKSVGASSDDRTLGVLVKPPRWE